MTLAASAGGGVETQEPLAASVLVCTRNRAQGLGECLKRIAATEAGFPWELVVVDNGSSDETAEVCKALAAELPVRFRYVHTPVPGLSVARNAGVELCRGEIIAFTDDDVLVDRLWLTTIIDFFNRHPDAWIVGGRVMPARDGLQPIGFLTETQSRTLKASNEAFTLLGANLAFRRSALDHLGSFDTRMGAGRYFAAGEEIDLIYRSIRLGGPVHYLAEAVVWHDHGRVTFDQLLTLNRAYGRGTAAFFAKQIWRGEPDIVRQLYWTMARLFARAWKFGPDRTDDARCATARLTALIWALPKALIQMR